MRGILLGLLLAGCVVGSARPSIPKPNPSVQAPALGVSFTCTPAGPACTEFLRLASDGLGYPGTGSRLTFLENRTLRHVRSIARDQKKNEDGKAAVNTAEADFNAAYPEP